MLKRILYVFLICKGYISIGDIEKFVECISARFVYYITLYTFIILYIIKIGQDIIAKMRMY